ncbi:hypothetical protein B0J18DRAFT_299259 [Chaetomium sp. MPI-SDFR-AT-0129]|nr:hypothetical protein B0J18DRAFT_299259 [Chaetomium sp. MPI-SDFR-AT-0129]
MPAIPMEVALPLALHLRSPVTYNFLTGESWKPGEKYQEGRSISQLAFIEQESERFKATLLFASILRSIYNHPDWSELHAFFTKRYSKSQTLSNRDARKLTAPADAIHNAGKTVVVDFNTDPSSVGLPRDLPAQLAAACRAARSTLVGPDPQPCSIGPAISVAMGGGAYMDLMYMGQPPGKYPERTLIAGQWYGWEGGKHGVVAGAIATTKKGGRGRSWGEWADLWRAIADWVYEHDATSLELHFLSVHSYKYRLSDQERRNMGFGLRVPRQYLSTDAISAADAIRDVFDQLEAEPTQFQGIEWDYLEFEFEREEQEAFRARFGRKDPDHKKTLEALVRPASLSRWDQVDYEDVSPVALKPCPDSFRGADWEAWLLSIEGGDVVVVKTPFQALWAVMLLSQFPLVIKIVNKEDKFPRYRDPAVASSSSSTPDRPTRAILSATFRKTYASFQDRTAVAQKQATPLTRARWAVVDEPKFRALISELKAINDSLTSLLPAVSNKTRVRMRAEIMQSNDANQLQNLVNAADDVADLISETASLRLEMLSTTGEGVPRRLQPRLVHVSDPAAAPQPTAETPQPAVIPSPAAVPTSRSQSPLPVASPPPTGPPEPRIDAYDDTGALVIHKVYSKPDSLSCYAWVSGQWEVPDLSEIQPVFHPAFTRRPGVYPGLDSRRG